MTEGSISEKPAVEVLAAGASEASPGRGTGPNHRVFENWSTNGVRTLYLELASGLHMPDGKGGFKESDHKISLDVNGAMADGATVKVRFTADINTKGGITAPSRT